ncbi:MAG: AraC family transcriptional regulator ligand-binding domain-containing protein, partial [Pseudomonadota bacterium]
MIISRQPSMATPALGYHPLYARLFCTLLQERGIDIDALLACAGLHRTDVASHARWIGHQHMHKLVRRARQLHPDPLLGLAWGARLGEATHGTAGTAIYSSADVRQGLHALIGLAGLRASTAHPVLREGSSHATLELAPRLPFNDVHDILFDAMALMVLQMLAPLLGKAIGQVKVSMPFAAPDRHAHYHRYFPCDLGWGAPQLIFRLPLALLDQACPLADANVHQGAMRQCELELLAADSSVAARVAGQLARQHDRF